MASAAHLVAGGADRLLRSLLEFGIGDGVVAVFFALLSEARVEKFFGGGQLGLSFIAAAEAEQNLATNKMNILIIGDKLFRTVERGERFAIFAFALIQPA